MNCREMTNTRVLWVIIHIFLSFFCKRVINVNANKCECECVSLMEVFFILSAYLNEKCI